MRIVALLLLLAWGQAWATTYYVCPGADEDGTDLNYGAEDGLAVATCFDGFADVAGLAAGDTLRVVNDYGSFFERYAIGASGTAGSLISVTGWSDANSAAAYATIDTTVKISGDQSFSAATTYATSGYAWTLVSGEVYKKNNSALAHLLFEDGTLLTPILGHGISEATIAATLERGQYANLTGTPNVLYYRASDGAAPSTHMLRMNDHRNDTSGPGAFYCSAQDYIDVRYLTLRGVYVLSVGTQQNAGLSLSDCENVTADYIESKYNLAGVGIDGGVNVAIGSNVVGSYNIAIGASLEATPVALTNVTLSGTYEYNSRLAQVATNGQTVGDIFDGDGVGIGQSGGTFTGIDVVGVTSRYNGAADNSTKTGGSGVYVGSSAAMSSDLDVRRSNLSFNHGCGLHLGDEWTGGQITGNIIQGNTRGQTTGTCLFSIWMDLRSTGGTYLGGTFANNVVADNYGSRAVSFDNSVAGNTLTFRNNIFSGNASGFGSGTKLADVVIGTAANDNILESHNDIYSTSVAAFYRGSAYTCAQVTAGTWGSVSANTGDSTVCIDPLWEGGTSPTTTAGFKPKVGSTMRRAGRDLNLGNIQDAGNRAFLHPPSIGAWEAGDEDAAAARTAATARTARQ